MELSYIDKIKGFLFTPVETLIAHRDEALKDAFKYLIVLIAIFAVFEAIVISLFGALSPAFPGLSALVLFLISIVFGIIGGLIMVVIGGLILHLFVVIVGGRRGLSATIKAVIYAATPAILFGWIPVVGLVALIWALVLGVLAIRELHEISTGRAAVAVVIPFAVLVILVILAAAFFMIATVTTGPAFVGPY
ncbi:MAG TPA: YIP1 family protein [Methanoculleus sp.]|nr:YIP1 family protein [Methanoculleus sp.]